MATWIVHLRIAENLLREIDGFVPSHFAVGNIAPDSGIPDEKWEKFTPPTEVTHFQAPNGSPYYSDDISYFRKYLHQIEIDKARYSFLWGYFCHIVTDNLWFLRIASPTHEIYKTQFEANPDFIWEVKKDWYGLDFVYVRNHPNSLFWNVFLDCEYPTNYLDILLPEGVQQRIEYIKTYYRRKDAETDEIYSRQRIYLTEEKVDQFVEEATKRLIHGINKLQSGFLPPKDSHSILESDE